MFQVYSGMQSYDPKIWFQVSRNKRLLARLPPGKTGNEALEEATANIAVKMANVPLFKGWPYQTKLDPSQEAESGEFYLRHLCPPEDQAILNQTEFNLFRAAGGRTYRESIKHGKVA